MSTLNTAPLTRDWSLVVAPTVGIGLTADIRLQNRSIWHMEFVLDVALPTSATPRVSIEPGGRDGIPALTPGQIIYGRLVTSSPQATGHCVFLQL